MIFPDGSRKPAEQLIRQYVLPKTECTVVVHMMRGQQAAPIDDNNFHIFVHSAESISKTVSVPFDLLGYDSQAMRSAVVSSSRSGTALADEASGFVFAQLANANNLYIHYQALAPAGPRLAQWCEVLERCARLITVDNGITTIIDRLESETPTAQAVRTVTVTGAEGRRAGILEALTSATIGRVVDKPIAVTVGHGEPFEARNDGRFHVFFNAGVAGNERLPSGKGIPFYTDTGELISELIGDNLFILRDLVRFGLSNQIEETARVLAAARDQLYSGPQAEQKQQARLINECRQAALPYASRPGDTAAAVRAAEQSLSIALKQARNLEQAMADTGAAAEAELGREFDGLLAVHKVRDVRVGESSIIVDTDTIYCTDPRTGNRHELGRFQIHLFFNGTVNFLNQTRQTQIGSGSVMNAPHVDGTGRPCLGNIGDLMPDLLRRRQFASAVQLSIVFLESVNVSDGWGRNIHHWPVAREA